MGYFGDSTPLLHICIIIAVPVYPLLLYAMERDKMWWYSTAPQKIQTALIHNVPQYVRQSVGKLCPISSAPLINDQFPIFTAEQNWFTETTYSEDKIALAGGYFIGHVSKTSIDGCNN